MPTPLLADDGTASMATMLMCSHHAFRRDLASFADALAVAEPRAAALAGEWASFRAALHGHHTSEDSGIFPDLRAKHPELAGVIDQLDAQHRAIDPLLEHGDRAFGDLPRHAAEARELVATLARLLDEHLDLEERTVIGHLRGATQFPLPPTADVIAIYAEGFAWSSGGISPRVLERVFALLPPALRAAIPAAREAFDARCRRVWGHVHRGASETSCP